MPATPSRSSEQAGSSRPAVVLCRVGAVVCAVPLQHVSETLRPLPVEALAGTASFIDGVSIIRGKPVPVVDLARLLGTVTEERRSRLLVVKVGERNAALAVAHVIGVRTFEPSTVFELPPLLAGVSSEAISAVGSLDARLLLMLEASKVLPPSTWATLEGSSA